VSATSLHTTDSPASNAEAGEAVSELQAVRCVPAGDVETPARTPTRDFREVVYRGQPYRLVGLVGTSETQE